MLKLLMGYKYLKILKLIGIGILIVSTTIIII